MVTSEWPEELSIRSGAAIPSRDVFRDLLGHVAGVRVVSDLLEAAKAAAFLTDALIVAGLDSRTMRMNH